MQTKRFVLFWLAFTAVASAQNFYPKKDAAFGQVVVGGGYETVINLTNRGTHSYVGTLVLFRTVNEQSVDWNPTVNGVAVQDGEYGVEIQPQATVTFRLTGSQLEAGAAILLSEDLLLDNLIEANLTYLILEKRSGERQRGHCPVQGVLPGFHSLREILGDRPRPRQRRLERRENGQRRTLPLLGRRQPVGAQEADYTRATFALRPNSSMSTFRVRRSTEARSRSLPTFPSSGRPSPSQADSSQVFHWTQPPSPIRFVLRSMKPTPRENLPSGLRARSFAVTW